MATVNLLNDDTDPYGFTPSVNQSNSAPTGTPGAQPYTNWEDEYNWFKPAALKHVQSKPFLYGKVNDSALQDAFKIFNKYRENPQFNRGDAYNLTLDDLGWWTGQVTSAPKTPSTASGGSGKTKTGNPQQDWMSLVQGLPANLQSIAQVFPQFAEWYPGSTFEKADIKGPWGWADTIGNLDSGNGTWQWYQGTGQKKPGLPGMIPGVQAPGSQFSDPLTKQYEALLQQQITLQQQQQQQMQAEAAQKQQVRTQTDEAVKRLLGYLDERVTKLGQPAYTDSEANIFQTRALDPLERDRTAANQRALQNIGARGFDPSSGIAQELLLQVNRAYDETRAGTQNELAFRQIEEQRSRDREKQKLLQYAAEAPMAAARGDIGFVNYLNDLINQPGQQSLAMSALLADLPVQRTALAAQVLGLGGQPQSNAQNLIALLDRAQRERYLNQGQQSGALFDLGKTLGDIWF